MTQGSPGGSVRKESACRGAVFDHLGQEDPLKEMVTLSNILAWEIPWIEEPGRLVHGVTKSWTGLSD